MSEEDILKAGISALKAGNQAQATSLFAKLVKEYPSSERGWYLLGMSVPAPDQREFCFRRVLAINPNNQDAKKQLAGLSRPAPASPHSSPTRLSQPSPVEYIRPKPVISATAFTEPVSQNPNRTSPVLLDGPEPLFTEENKAPKVTTAASSKQEINDKSKAPSISQKKKSKRALLISLGATLTGICMLAVGVLMFPGMLNQLLSPSISNGQGNAPLLPTQTMMPLIPTSTITPISPTTIPSPMPTVVYTPKYEETACPFISPEGVRVNCGYAIVPEDRTGDPSHTIRLAVAVFHSTNKKPSPVPVIFLQGGPGGEAVQLSANAYDGLVAPFLPERDYVTFDQRGTGLSEPALVCDELSKTYHQDIYGLLPLDTKKLVYSNAFISCSGLMSVKGLNLNAYTTVESAADLKDIAQLLGYEKVDLYGASYGTRLAQVVMRDYPEIVHSAVLDSVVPVETNFFEHYPDSIESALNTLFTSCALDLECNAAYPNLDTVFWDIVNSLDANPVTLTTSTYPIGTVTENVDSSVFMSVILGLIKSSSFIDTAPQSIYRVKNGDYSTLIAAQYSLPYGFEGINTGLYISMMCHEHILATTPEELEAVSIHPDIKNYAWLPFYGAAKDLFKSCKSWGAIPPLPSENAPVNNNIPTLVITGKFDPATPPTYGQQVADHLEHGYYFEFPNQGHVPTATDSTGCAMDIVFDFLDNPNIEPDGTCLNKLPKVKFLVPYTGKPALKLKKENPFDVSVNIPEDWFFTFDGFFMRAESAFDITQVGAFRASISEQELKDYFSLSAYGYRGLDNAPVESGTRRANGLTWKLLVAASNGRPVDIAMADDGGTSIILMMFSHADEHDALYRTVFLPMVDSAR